MKINSTGLLYELVSSTFPFPIPYKPSETRCVVVDPMFEKRIRHGKHAKKVIAHICDKTARRAWLTPLERDHMHGLHPHMSADSPNGATRQKQWGSFAYAPT